jgi:hypothetical protein
MNDENLIFLNSLSIKQTFLRCSDMLFSPAKGRPFGGRSFIISKELEILNHDFINQHISTLSNNSNNKIFTFIACYFPYDNGSALNFS